MMSFDREEVVQKESWHEELPYTFEVNGKVMQFDTEYPSSSRGLIKFIEIVLCFLSLVLVSYSQPVQDERGLPLFFSSVGIIVSFTLLISYVLLLNIRIQSTPWFITEVVLYVLLICGLSLSGLFMAIFCARHWADINPQWETMPALAAGALFTTAAVYITDLVILLLFWKRWSWHPSTNFDQPPATTVLPY